MVVRDTSITTYQDIIEEGLVGKKQIEVFSGIVNNPNKTDKEMSLILDMNINAITGRRNELVNFGLIEGNIKRKCTITGRLAYQWRLVEKIPSRVDLDKSRRTIKTKCPMCNGTGYIKEGQQTLWKK